MYTTKSQHAFPNTLAILAIVLLMANCREDSTSPIVPPDTRPVLDPQDIHSIILTLTDYDVVRVTHKAGLDLRSSDIIRVGIGAKDSMGYTQLLSANSTYDTSAQTYIIHYDFTVRMDSTLINANIVIRYFTSDSTFTDADTIFSLYKYPYQAANVVVTNSIVPYQSSFQDISRIGNKFYFHPQGPDGLYEYDLNSHLTRSLFEYSSGDHLAADSVFIFIDVDHNSIERFNILNDSVDLHLHTFSTGSILGMETFNKKLFVLHDNPPIQLEVFSFDGTALDTIPYATFTYYLTIYDSIAFSVDVNSSPNQVTRFDLRTKTFLSNVAAPAKTCDGIKVHGNQFYYCDYNKGFIGVIPVIDLKPTGD